MRVSTQNQRFTVRLIGVDRPEIHENEKAIRQQTHWNGGLTKSLIWGERAKNAVQTLIKPQDWVRLEFDLAQVDRYDRVLAYVYLKNGLSLNEWLLRQGLAIGLFIKPNFKHRKHLSAIAEGASNNRVGIFQDYTP